MYVDIYIYISCVYVFVNMYVYVFINFNIYILYVSNCTEIYPYIKKGLYISMCKKMFIRIYSLQSN